MYDDKTTKRALLLMKEQIKKYLAYGNNIKIFINMLNILQNDKWRISHFVNANL